MNKTSSTVRSFLSDSQSSKKSFRVLVKNRITHETQDPQIQKIKTPNHIVKSTEDESFQSVKDNLKKYIKNMKGTSKIGNYNNKINTNRSSCQLSQKNSQINSSRSKILSSKQLGKSIRSSFVINEKINLTKTESDQQVNSNQKMEQNQLKKTVRYHTESEQIQKSNLLPLLRNVPQSNIQQKFFNEQENNHTVPQTTQRQKIRQLESKIESLLVERLKMLSSSNSFSSSQQVKNKTAYKLLEKQMDRVLQQLRKIKENEETISQNIETDVSQRDFGINKNIEMLEKKVKIIERLIAQKLFQADNLRSQYLEKVKQNRSAIYERKSKSSTFYRQVNNFNPKFKPQPYTKSPICQNDSTTNRASYKMPLKSYYIKAQKDQYQNSNKLTQPLPRSTYNCQYLIYGTIPKQLIGMKSGQQDHKIFSNTLSDQNQKNILKGSTYKVDFAQKIDKDPVNFKQLDCYKDKFKNLQVNYGNKKHEGKIVNSRSVIEFYEEDKKKTSRSKLQSFSAKHVRQNSQKDSNSLLKCQRKHSDTKSRVEELNRSIDQMKQSETKVSMIEQEQLRKNNLFNQRIRSQIKHKNVYDQKYKFKNQLMKQRLRKIQGLSNKDSLVNNLTIEY